MKHPGCKGQPTSAKGDRDAPLQPAAVTGSRGLGVATYPAPGGSVFATYPAPGGSVFATYPAPGGSVFTTYPADNGHQARNVQHVLDEG